MSNYNDEFIIYDNFVINKFDSQFITIRMLNDIKITLKKNPFIINCCYGYKIDEIVSISRFVKKDKSIIYYLSTSQSDKLKEELPKVREFLIQTYEN